MRAKKQLWIFAIVLFAWIACLIGADAQKTVSSAKAAQLPAVKIGYSVRYFGAKGDGKTLDTPAINKAIEAAAAAGGGTVHFPAGTYLCFSIHLKSNIALYLDPGATILAADQKEGKGR